MVRKIFSTLLFIGVLFFSVLFCIEFVKERNILSAVLAGTVCLLTINNIIVVYKYGYSSRNLAITISGTLYFLGTKDIVLIVISLIVTKEFMGNSSILLPATLSIIFGGTEGGMIS